MLPVLRLILLVLLLPVQAQAQQRHRAMELDAGVYREAIALERRQARSIPASGITVPHHLVAADLMARAFLAVEGNRYDRIILLTPDHFFRSKRPIATTRQGFDTVFGPVEVDGEAVERLAGETGLVEVSDLFASEHGIHALLPFVRMFFADVPVVPVAVTIGSRPEDWRRAAEALKPLMTPTTLVIQSTDFSHYLLPHLAAARDQETLNLISATDPEAIGRLHQPDHIDSRGAQTIQMLLQRDVGGHGVVVANRNQAEYQPLAQRSTSYVATVYARKTEDGAKLRFDDQQAVYFGGDVFPGRGLTLPLIDAGKAARAADVVKAATGGQGLIVNLEGVMMDEPPPGVPRDLHVFSTRPAADVLKAMGVVAAGLANNHAHDLGNGGAQHSRKALAAHGIRPLDHMKVVDMGAFRLVALNYIGGKAHGAYPAVRGRDVEALCRMKARRPFVAFVHWGEEYTTAPPAEALAQAEALHACGVALIVGAHTHQAVAAPWAIAGGMYQLVYSLGNLLFDQHSPRGTGAILEVRFFRQGTFATRLIPVPNIYDILRPPAGERMN